MAFLNFLKPKQKIDEVHTTAIGDYGTIDEGLEVSAEPKPPLRGLQGSFIYEKMSFDSQIGMMLNMIKTPILSADWDISTSSDDKKHKFHAKFCKDYFFKNYPIAFVNLLYQLLSFTEYGFSIFEQVYSIWDYEGKRYTVPELLARLQVSIEEIQPRNEIIQQRRTDGQLVDIPFEYLVFFVLNQEGDDLRGTSLLRWSYWDWKRKSETEVIDTIGVRKNAIGVPDMVIPKSVKPDSPDYKAVQSILQRIGRSQNPYMIRYPDYVFTWQFGNYNNAITNQKISRHNTQMAKSVMTQFLELGQASKGGSFALGDVQSQIFLDSLQYLIDLITNTFNNKIIKPMIDINFGKQDVYPELIGLNVNKGKIQTFITNYALLIEKGAIKPTISDEDFIRTKMEMPNLTEEQKIEREKQIAEPQPKPSEPMPLSENATKLKLAEKSNSALQKERNKFVEKNKPLLTDFMRENMTVIKEKLLVNLEKILNKGQIPQRGILNLDVPLINKYRSGLVQKVSYFVGDGFLTAKKDAKGHTTKLKLAEIPDVDPNNLPDNLKVYAKNMSNNVIDDQTTSMKVKAVFVAQNKTDKGFTTKQTIAEVNKSLDDYILSGPIGTASSHLITDGSNVGFMDFGKQNPDLIQAYQFIAVDDGNTTDICRWLNGHIYSVGGIALSQVRPPLHFNCRSFMRPIYADEPKAKIDDQLPPPSIWAQRSF